MAPQSVDLKPIRHLYLENLISFDENGTIQEDAAIKVVGHELVAQVFKGTDYFLTKDGHIERTGTAEDGSPKKISRPLSEEASVIHWIKSGDKDGNEKLTLVEARNLLKSVTGSGEVSDADAAEFLAQTAADIEQRWAVMASNMVGVNTSLQWSRTVHAIETYNKGIWLDEVNQSHMTFGLNSLTKTGANTISYIPNKLFGSDKSGELWADRKAEKLAGERYQKRSQAIAAFKNLLEEGANNHEEWAIDGNIKEAFKRLTPEDRAVLEKEIPSIRIHKALTIEDDKKRAEALFELAVAERPGFLGYGGGNAGGISTANVFNYTGRHNNLYFARSLLAELSATHDSGDPEFDQKFIKKVEEERIDSLGDGGSFTNVIAAGLDHIICLGGLRGKPTPFRAWGDENRRNAVGQALDFGLTFYGSFKFGQFAGEVVALGRTGRLNAVRKHFSLRPRWAGGKGFQPLPVQALRAERNLHRSETLFLDLRTIKLPDIWGRATDLLAMGLGLHYAIQNSKTYAKTTYFNPFEADHDMELAPYPDLTKPVSQ